MRALQLETQLRTDPELRADRFVANWTALRTKSEQQYVAGHMSARRETRAVMADLAHNLHRDPQLESVLAQRKQQLGIRFTTGRSLGDDLASSLGLGRGRGSDCRGADVLQSASRDRQHLRFVQAGIAGLLAGIVLWSFLPGVIAWSLPASWHAPDRWWRVPLGWRCR
ncbi:hypothetical protein [Novosphingobium sp. 9]|uniref:hypothetical protein n=1 Tax=Novosphingobium sp. 9 TaxID=2025349 RepID=UPI0021B61094|nr:hypothetical protein [Novosphingobium sp. 9]